MNVGLVVLGVVFGTVLGVALTVSLRRRHRLAVEMTRTGTAGRGVVEQVRNSGRYGTYRRVTVRVDSGTFVDPMPAIEWARLGAEPGDAVDVVVVADERKATLRGRIDRPIEPPPSVWLGVAIGTFVFGLFVVLAVVTRDDVGGNDPVTPSIPSIEFGEP